MSATRIAAGVLVLVVAVSGTAHGFDGSSGTENDQQTVAWFHKAAEQGLLSARSNLDAVASHGETALTLASQNGYLDVVQALIAKGADVNAGSKNNGGLTAMIMARNAEIGAVLVAAVRKTVTADRP